MTRDLRAIHRKVWTVLPILLAALLIVALRARPSVAEGTAPPGTTGPEPPHSVPAGNTPRAPL